MASVCQKAAWYFSGVEIETQKAKFFWENSKIKPDIIIKNGDKSFILDTKWKDNLKKPSDGDLKQMFAYNIYWKSPQAYILYPANHYDEPVSQSGMFSANDLLDPFNHRVCLFPVYLFKDGGLNKKLGKDLLDSILSIQESPEKKG